MNARGTAAVWLRAVIALSLLLGVFFRFYGLGHKTFWDDEILGRIHALGYTEAQIVVASPHLLHASDLQQFLGIGSRGEAAPALSATVRSLALEDPQHPPGYYVLAHLWTRLFGSRVDAVRALPALFGVLALPCMFLLARELFDSGSVGWIAAALLALSPFFVLYAQEAREYSLWTVIVLLDGWLLLRAMRAPSLGAWAGYTALAAIGLYVDPLMGLAMLGWFAYVLGCERLRLTRRASAAAISTFVAVAAFAPWLRIMAASQGLERGMAAIVAAKLSVPLVLAIGLRNVRLIFFDFGLFRIGPLSSSVVNAAFTVVAAGIVLAAAIGLVRQTGFRTWGFVVVGLWLPMSLLLLDDIFLHGRFVYQMRYFTPAIVGVLLAVAALLGTSRAKTQQRRVRGWRPAVATVLVAGCVLSCAVSSRASTWWNKDYEQSATVARAVNAASGALVVSDYYPHSALALAYGLDPHVAMRLNLRCAQCTLPDPPPRDLLVNAGTYGAVFALADTPPPEAAVAGRTEMLTYIDPHPYPDRDEPLALYRSMGTNAAAHE